MQTILTLGNALNQGTARGALFYMIFLFKQIILDDGMLFGKVFSRFFTIVSD